MPLRLANLYAPNWDDSEFFSKLILNLNSHKLILSGDFNCVLDPNLDISKKRQNNSLSKSAAVINSFLQTYNVSDPLHTSDPVSKHYSFFSPVHQSYSRTDYFLIPAVTPGAFWMGALSSWKRSLPPG